MSFPFHKLRACLALGALLLAAACDDDFKDSLRMSREAPDEFSVVSRPSLSVPPEFTLRPPRPGEAPRQPTADEAARSIVTGKPTERPLDPAELTQPSVETAVTPVIATTPVSGPAAALLKRAGADHANDHIRDELNEDVNRPVENSNAKSLLEQVSGDSKAEPVIDPKKEAERLRANKDEGKPANEGEVQDVPNKPRSVLDRIF